MDAQPRSAAKFTNSTGGSPKTLRYSIPMLRICCVLNGYRAMLRIDHDRDTPRDTRKIFADRDILSRAGPDSGHELVAPYGACLYSGFHPPDLRAKTHE